MIPIFDITRQNKILKKELDQAIKSVIKSGVFILGPKVAEFEKEFAKYLGVRYAVGVASGTDAISLALMAVGVSMGDEVVMPANAYPSVFGVTAVEAVPKLVDVDPVTFNIDPVKIPAVITPKTKAILPVHMYGQPADMEAIMKVGKKYNIAVVEDCAQAHGAALNFSKSPKSSRLPKSPRLPRSLKSLKETTEWRKVGSIGTVGCFSFYPTKNLGCFGDGGMVVTNNKEIYDKVKLLRMYGEKSRYNSIILGRNSRLDELQAAILLVKLKYLDKWNERRREIAQRYIQSLRHQILSTRRVNNDSETPLQSISSRQERSALHLGRSQKLISSGFSKLNLSIEPNNSYHVYHLLVIRAQKRDELKTFLEKKGIQTAIHYPVPIHLVPSMKYLGYKKGDFPVAEKLAGEILSLPMFPELSKTEIEKVASEISVFYL